MFNNFIIEEKKLLTYLSTIYDTPVRDFIPVDTSSGNIQTLSGNIHIETFFILSSNLYVSAAGELISE